MTKRIDTVADEKQNRYEETMSDAGRRKRPTEIASAREHESQE
jgi:hypothetical protein